MRSWRSEAFRQRLAAFRDWKLVAGRGDSLSLTETARIIARPPSPADERDALQSAFRNCTVFLRLYEEMQKETALGREALGNTAIHRLQVSPTSVNKFVDSFVESAVAVGLVRESDDGQITLVEPSARSDDVSAGVEEHAPAMTPSPATSEPSSPSTPFAHRSAWPIAGGTIVFEIGSDQPLPARAYSTVGEVVASLERLSQALAASSTEPTADADTRE